MRYDRECLYDVPWQLLRLQMVGGWTMRSGISTNLERLSVYVDLGFIGKNSPERIWRALNCLNAVLLGYGQGAALGRDPPDTKPLVVASRDLLSLEHQERPLDTLKKWDWELVRNDMQMPTWTYSDLRYLRTNLQRRLTSARRRKVDPKVTRPELVRFLDMLNTELLRRRRSNHGT